MKNAQIEEMLKNIVKLQKVINGYIFSGIGKCQNYKFAREFAKMILCMENNDNCMCKSCIMFDDKNHTDFYEINKDKNDSIKIDEIRELESKINIKPITSQKKVYIINNAENMTKEAQNCLLKTLEEPPDFVTIILVVNDENNILTTIKSRCARIVFTEENKEEFTDDEKQRYLDCKRIFGNIEKYKSIDLLNKADVLYKDKENVFQNLEFINMIFFEKSKNDRKYLKYIDVIEQTKRKIKLNSNFDMCIDYLILNIWEGD